MGLFSGQFANVVEWEEYRDDILFWKWSNREIKKGSRLIIRPGQDAIFMFNGKREGVFTDDGSYDIESQIIPFLSTLKGFKFGFNSGLRAEVIFINTKQFTIRWGTKNPVRIPAPQLNLPGGLPIRSNGTFVIEISDYIPFIANIAGVKQQYSIDEVKERVMGMLDGLLVKWITKVGGDIFNLSSQIMPISNGIKEDLGMDLAKIGISIDDFRVSEFTYPEGITKTADTAAAQSMIGDMGKYQQVKVADAMGKGGSNIASDMVGMQMGMMMGQQMMNGMNNQNNMNNMNNMNRQDQQPAAVGTGVVPKFCPNCGTPTNGAKFCPNCGTKLV